VARSRNDVLGTYKIKASQCSSSEALKVRKVDIPSTPLDEVAVCLRTFRKPQLRCQAMEDAMPYA
jgi:hypothetical protein